MASDTNMGSDKAAPKKQSAAKAGGAGQVGELRMRLLAFMDQMAFSVANFIMTLVFARHFTDSEFASYGIGLSAALLVQGVQRATYVIPTSLLSSARAQRIGPGLIGEHFIVLGSLLLLGFVGFIGSLALSLDAYATNIILCTVMCLLIYLQADYDRVLQFKYGLFYDPLITSVAYGLLIVAMSAVTLMVGVSFHTFVGAIYVFVFVKIAWLQMRTTRPNLRWGLRVLARDAKVNTGWSIVGTFGYAGYNHIPLFVLGFTSPPVQAAAFVAMRSLLQPIQILARSFDVVDKHLFHRLQSGAVNPTSRIFWRSITLYFGIGLAAAVTILLFSHSIVRIVYGSKFEGFEHLLAGWAVLLLLFVLTLPIETIVFSHGRIYEYNIVRLIGGAAGVIISLLLCSSMGASGAIIACIAGWFLAVFGAFIVIRREVL